MRMEPPPIYFMHIPRTGGSALGQWLRTAYGRAGYVDLKVEELPGMSESSLQRFSCYHSWHLGKRLFDWINRTELACMTMLRQPVERTVSDIYGIQRTALHHAGRFTAEGLSMIQPCLHSTIDECVRSGVLDILITDAQSSILGSTRNYIPFSLESQRMLRRPVNIFSWFDFPWLEGATLASDADTYRRAHAWLDGMSVVGLTERYPESLMLISDLLGIPVPSALPRENVNPQRGDSAKPYGSRLAPDVTARIEELNRNDMDLYAHAAELFEQQWARYQARPRRTYSIAPRLRQVLQPRKLLKRIRLTLRNLGARHSGYL
jgi:hypothetical protein